MARPNKDTQKVFAIASTLGAVLMSHNNGEPKLIALQVQINKAMKVFYRMAGHKEYWRISNEVQKLWLKVAKKHENNILEEEIPVFVEYLSLLVPKAHFKTFLSLQPYRTDKTIRPEINTGVCKSVLTLDEEFNQFFGTSAYTVSKPKQVVSKVKKQRDKSKKTTTTKQPSKSKLKEAQRKSNTRSFLRDKIAKAKANE